MNIELLLKKVIKSDDYTDPETRLQVGYIAGWIGVLVNLLLAILKIVIGLFISSISVIVDGVNNFADSGSSVITLIGFKISSLPPDKEHPYGHGRVEHLAALLVSFIVILVGLQFTKSSVERIINPQPIYFEIITFSALVISISVKIWLSLFNKKLGGMINSSGLKASATDAMGDVLITSVVSISILIGQFTTFPIDGFIGVFVSLFIIYSGYNLVKETLNPLIGEAPPEETIKSIYNLVLGYENVIGAHDLVIHSYGAGKDMATIDLEIPNNIDLVAIHDIIDSIEKDIESKFNISTVIHMDPVGHETHETRMLKKKIIQLFKEIKSFRSIHDFRVTGVDDCRIIEMHVVLDGLIIKKDPSCNLHKDDMENIIKKNIDCQDCKILVDIEY